MANKEQWLEYKAVIKETAGLLSAAYKTTKRPSTLQFAKDRFKVGMITKEKYISILKSELN